MFVSVVPMSWSRLVRRYVSVNAGQSQVGKWWVRIARPGVLLDGRGKERRGGQG